MGLFLQIVLAVLLVIAGLALSAWWWFKRRISRAYSDYTASSELIDPAWLLPARIRLQPAANVDLSQTSKDLWEQLHALGFRRLADMQEACAAFEHIRVGKFDRFIVVLTQENDESSLHTVFALSTDNHLLAFGNGPQPGLSNNLVHWQVDPNLTPEEALAKLTVATEGQSLRDLDERLVRTVCERAYASRIDARLALPLNSDEFRRQARLRNPAATDAQVQQALEIVMSVRTDALEESVLDHYRRDSKLDAVRWEQLRDSIHVVHGEIDQDTLLAPFFDYCDEQDEQRLETLTSQHVAQGYSGAALFERIANDLGGGLRYRRLAAVNRPISAVLFALDPDTEVSAAAKTHVYEATTAAGDSTSGVVLAADSADAKRRLAQMGMTDQKVLLEPTALDELGDSIMSPEQAAAAARSTRESIWIGLARALMANALLWVPITLIVTWNIYQGPPYSWGDYFGFACAAVAAALTVGLVAPIALYHQLLQLRVHKRWRRAQLCLSVLRRLNWLGGAPKAALDADQAKIITGLDGLSAGLAYWQQFEAELEQDAYATGLVQVFDVADDVERMIDAQRRVLALSVAKDLARVDLAMSLTRNMRSTEESEDLLAQVDAAGLAELALGGYHFTRGMICASRDQHAYAINQYMQATACLGQFQNNPLMVGFLAEINGYVALALKQTGESARAEELWARVKPLFEAETCGKALIARYEQAATVPEK